jgi:hypothetical protein
VLENPKWEAFAVAYAQHGNGTKAALEAGFTPGRNNNQAAQRAVFLLKKPEVAKRIEQIRQTLKRKASASAGVDRAWVLDRLKGNAEEALERGDRAAANRALELIGKELNMFIDKKMVVYGPLDALTAPQLQRLLALAEAAEAGRLALPSSNVTALSEATDIIDVSPLSTHEPVPIEVLDAVEEAEDEDIDPLS